MAITEEQNDFLVETYLSTGNKTKQTLDIFKEKYHFAVTATVLYSKLKLRGIARNPMGGKRNGLSQQEFMDLHNLYGGRLEDMAAASGYTCNTIRKQCKKYELSYTSSENNGVIRPINKVPLIDEKYDRIFSSPSRR